MISLRRGIAVLVMLVAGFAAGCGDNTDREVPDDGVCGDSVVNPGEQCDNGSNNGSASGACQADCTWRCDSNAVCNDGNLCNGEEACVDHVCVTGTAAPDQTSCGSGMACRAGMCANLSCGDGVVNGTDECDDDNATPGDGCEADCKFTCVADNAARGCPQPADACAGATTCSADHVCSTPTQLPDDSNCGGDDQHYCRAGVCLAISCGNGVTDRGEECDGGEGCAATCQFACVSTDATRNCALADACAGTSACDDSTHVCSTPTPQPDNSDCGGDDQHYCRSGVCLAISCGNGITDRGEECDGGEGCTATCQFTCVSTDPARDCAITNVCQGESACNDTTHLCEVTAPAPDDGTVCGDGQICLGSICSAIRCGDGFVSPGEECDDNSDGCVACRFSCVSTDPTRNCALPDACAGTSACNDTSHQCSTPTTPVPDNEQCPGGEANQYCSAGVCLTAECGNGTLDLLTGEQCDDGNVLSLDGCDNACKFEQAQRITALKQQFTGDDFCPGNALGAAIAEAGQETIQSTWDLPVQLGALSVVFKFLGLTDLSGANSTFTLGFVNATPVMSPNAVPSDPNSPFIFPYNDTHDGTNDLDWWYRRDPASVDANENPIIQLSGQIQDHHLTAGPGTLSLPLLFVLEPAQVTLFNARVDAMVSGPVSVPTARVGNEPLGHLASEHLAPGLTSFSGSQPNADAPPTGAMCSDVSVQSLFNTRMPELLRGLCGDEALNPLYTTENRLLDVFLAGCFIFGQKAVNPTQPDGSIDGATYAFAVDATSHTVVSCTRNGEPAELPTCVANATYSSYFKFSTDRVIIKRD